MADIDELTGGSAGWGRQEKGVSKHANFRLREKETIWQKRK
jgi:hypothetical protein